MKRKLYVLTTTDTLTGRAAMKRRLYIADVLTLAGKILFYSIFVILAITIILDCIGAFSK